MKREVVDNGEQSAGGVGPAAAAHGRPGSGGASAEGFETGDAGRVRGAPFRLHPYGGVRRLLCGIAPWLELGPDGSAEGALRRRYAELTLEAVAAAVDPASPDYLWAPPDEPKPNLQLLVDTAFFAHALVRAPRRLIGGMTPELRKLTAIC